MFTLFKMLCKKIKNFCVFVKGFVFKYLNIIFFIISMYKKNFCCANKSEINHFYLSYVQILFMRIYRCSINLKFCIFLLKGFILKCRYLIYIHN